MIYPIALQRLLPRVGFPWATRILAFLALSTFLGAIIILYTRPQPPKPAKVRSYLDMSAFEEPAFGFFCMAFFWVFWAYYVPFFFIPTYAKEVLAASSDFSVYLLAITNAATMVGRIMSAFVAQKIGPIETVAIYTFACGVLLFGWVGVRSIASFDVWTVIFGLCAGPLVTIPAAVVPQISPNLGVVGTRLGMIWAFAALDGLVGSPVAGTLNGPQQKHFLPSQIMVGIVMIAGAILVRATWVPIVKQQQHTSSVITWRGRREIVKDI